MKIPRLDSRANLDACLSVDLVEFQALREELLRRQAILDRLTQFALGSTGAEAAVIGAVAVSTLTTGQKLWVLGVLFLGASFATALLIFEYVHQGIWTRIVREYLVTSLIPRIRREAGSDRDDEILGWEEFWITKQPAARGGTGRVAELLVSPVVWIWSVQLLNMLVGSTLLLLFGDGGMAQFLAIPSAAACAASALVIRERLRLPGRPHAAPSRARWS